MEPVIMIRAMTMADVDAVIRIYAEVFNPSYISFGELGAGQAEALGRVSDRAIVLFHEEVVSFLGSAQHGAFVAMVNGAIVGFALAALRGTKAGHLECWLNDLGVSPAWQRRGIAQALVRWVLDWGSCGNARYFLLESGVHNTAAHRLFERLGFQPLATVFWHDRTR